MKKRIEKLIEEKLSQEDEKSHRDVAFLRSLSASYDKWGDLTSKQKSAFERMEFLNSPEGMKEATDWKREYTEKHATTAQTLSIYYLKNTCYFRDIATKIISDSNFVPTRRQFEALSGNKYAKKVVTELKREPVFAKGSLVKIREISGVPMNIYPLRGRICVVIDNKLQSISSHAAGSKEYRVLPFGSADTFVCQERYMKAMRKKAK